MRKIGFIIFLIITLLLLAVSGSLAEAQSDDNGINGIMEISSPNLGIVNPGILPTSPFYFIKEWRSLLFDIFTFNPIKKARLSLDNVNEKAAEIEMIKEITPRREEFVLTALQNYKESFLELKSRLANLTETSQDPNIDRLISDLVSNSIKHRVLFSGMKREFGDNFEIRKELNLISQGIDEVIANVPVQFDTADVFASRLSNFTRDNTDGLLVDVQTAEILDEIRDRLTDDSRVRVRELENGLVWNITLRINNLEEKDREDLLNLKILEKLGGDESRLINILGQIKAGLDYIKAGSDNKPKLELEKSVI